MGILKGAVPFARLRAGAKLTRSRAMLAKCYDCMGFYVDGAGDCGCPDCPLYFWMPYKGKVLA
ncbi:MAG: hypothetical protein WC294_00710 [Methanoregula sp.]|jgi:hypothetical protein